MSKSLNDAIGCWTVNLNYNALPVLAKMVSVTAARCRSITFEGDPARLLDELNLLRRQIDSFAEVTDSAITRCKQIIATNELA